MKIKKLKEYPKAFICRKNNIFSAVYYPNECIKLNKEMRV